MPVAIVRQLELDLATRPREAELEGLRSAARLVRRAGRVVARGIDRQLVEVDLGHPPVVVAEDGRQTGMDGGALRHRIRGIRIPVCRVEVLRPADPRPRGRGDQLGGRTGVVRLGDPSRLAVHRELHGKRRRLVPVRGALGHPDRDELHGRRGLDLRRRLLDRRLGLDRHLGAAVGRRLDAAGCAADLLDDTAVDDGAR